MWKKKQANMKKVEGKKMTSQKKTCQEVQPSLNKIVENKVLNIGHGKTAQKWTTKKYHLYQIFIYI